MARYIRLSNELVTVDIYTTTVTQWAVYSGPLSHIQAVAQCTEGFLIDGAWYRPLSGALVVPGQCLLPETIGQSLLKHLPLWQQSGYDADFRYVIADAAGNATWLLPCLGTISQSTVWKSTAWLDTMRVYGGTVEQSIVQHYNLSAPMQLASALQYYEHRRQPRQLRPALWLGLWTIALVSFIISLLTPAQPGVVVPTVLGASQQQAQQTLSQSTLQSRTTGIGSVVRQSPGAGSVVSRDTTIRLTLSP